MYCLSVLKARQPKSRCKQDVSPLKLVVRVHHAAPITWWPQVLLGWWPHHQASMWRAGSVGRPSRNVQQVGVNVASGVASWKPRGRLARGRVSWKMQSQAWGPAQITTHWRARCPALLGSASGCPPAALVPCFSSYLTSLCSQFSACLSFLVSFLWNQEPLISQPNPASCWTANPVRHTSLWIFLLY